MEDFDKNTLLSSTLKELGRIAKEDGKITWDELELLKQASFDIPVYEDALKEALEDSVITKEEADRLNNLKEQILSNVNIVANFDKNITEEEKNMIKKLTEIVSKYYT